MATLALSGSTGAVYEVYPGSSAWLATAACDEWLAIKYSDDFFDYKSRIELPIGAFSKISSL